MRAWGWFLIATGVMVGGDGLGIIRGDLRVGVANLAISVALILGGIALIRQQTPKPKP
jgi:hypothetical protein